MLLHFSHPQQFPCPDTAVNGYFKQRTVGRGEGPGAQIRGCCGYYSSKAWADLAGASLTPSTALPPTGSRWHRGHEKTLICNLTICIASIWKMYCGQTLAQGN